MPAPKPVAVKAAADDDESVAAMLLGLEDDGSPGALVGEDSIPGGSTVMETAPGSASSGDANQKPASSAANKPAAKPPTGNTSNAAKAILDKYLRRPRA